MDLRPDRGLCDPRGKLKCLRGDAGENIHFGKWVWQLLDREENFGTAMKTCGRPDDQKMNGKNHRNLKGFMSASDTYWGPERASPLLQVPALTTGVQGTAVQHRLLSQAWIQSLWTLLFCNRKWTVPTEPAIICNVLPFTLIHYEIEHRCVNNGEAGRWRIITQSSLSGREVEALWF